MHYSRILQTGDDREHAIRQPCVEQNHGGRVSAKLVARIQRDVARVACCPKADIVCPIE